MQAVILVGGEGRRLRPLTDTKPKPMLRLVDRPFVEHQLDHLRRFGVDHVVFSCGYLPEALTDYFGDGARVGMRLSYVVDPEPLGTGGAIKNAESELDPSAPLLVLNGDVLTDLDLAALIRQHTASGVDGTLALTPVDDPSRYGLVRLFDDRRVEEFLEKPSADQLRPGEPFLINAGTYLFTPAVLSAIPAGRASSIERDIFPVLAAEGRLAGFPSDAYWRDIGTPDSYRDAHLDVLSGVVATESPTGSGIWTRGSRWPTTRSSPGSAPWVRVAPLRPMRGSRRAFSGRAVAWGRAPPSTTPSSGMMWRWGPEPFWGPAWLWGTAPALRRGCASWTRRSRRAST